MEQVFRCITVRDSIVLLLQWIQYMMFITQYPQNQGTNVLCLYCGIKYVSTMFIFIHIFIIHIIK